MLDLRLSVSKLKTFSDCKKKYEFCYILKLPRKEQIFHTFGKLAHKILEDFHNEYINGSQEPFNIVMTKCYKHGIEEFGPTLTKELKKECWDIINSYLKLIYDQKKNNTLPNVLTCEKSFDFPIIENVILNGMIDKIQIDPDNIIHIIDYKTTKNKSFLEKDSFQLLSYAYVMFHENENIDKIRTSYVLLRHNFELITFEFNKEEILSVKNKYEQYARNIINEKIFSATTSKLCAYCDYLDNCSEGLKTITQNNIFGKTNW